MTTSKRIYLIGFMGSGKSHIGKALAIALNWEFLDLDAFLEAKEGQTITEIFEEGGEKLFRQLEQNYLQNTIDFENTVIATGGGAPCFFDNMDWMNANGETIYLKTPTSILAERLKAETEHRPLLAGKTTVELMEFIEKKVTERSVFYEQANLIFEYQTGRETADDLRAKLFLENE